MFVEAARRKFIHHVRSSYRASQRKKLIIKPKLEKSRRFPRDAVRSVHHVDLYRVNSHRQGRDTNIFDIFPAQATSWPCNNIRMASRGGPRPWGSDGLDFAHREKVANHYKVRWVLRSHVTYNWNRANVTWCHVESARSRRLVQPEFTHRHSRMPCRCSPHLFYCSSFYPPEEHLLSIWLHLTPNDAGIH